MHLFCHIISIIVISNFIMSQGVEVNMSQGVEVNKEVVITDETINKAPESITKSNLNALQLIHLTSSAKT